MWSGSRQDADWPDAYKVLPEIQQLLLAGKNVEAEALVNANFTCQMEVYRASAVVLLGQGGQDLVEMEWAKFIKAQIANLFGPMPQVGTLLLNAALTLAGR